MPSNFGSTPLSTTTLAANQFPVSAGFVPNTASGNLTSIQLGPSSTDTNGYASAPVAVYIADGSSLVEGATTDVAVTGDVSGTISAKLRGLSKIFAQLQFDGSNFLKVNIAAGTVAATQSGAWNINNISGTISLPTGAALDATVAKLTIAQSTALGSTTGPMVQGSVTTSSPTYTTGNINPLSLTTAGALRVDASATIQPVSVASLPALPSHQSTNVDQWNGTTVDTNSGNKSAGTVRVVIATDQPSLSNALSVSQSGSWTITANAGTNLNTSSLALDTSVNGLLLSQASTTSGQKGPLAQGAVTTNAPTYTTAQTNPLSLDTSGLLRVSLKDTPANTNNLNVALAASSATVTVSASGNFNNASVSSTGSAVPASASYVGGNKGGNLTGLSLDGSGNLNVNVAAGSSGNAAASATGSAVPADADYTGINVAGNLRGQTGVNPSGSIYAGQVDVASIAGSSVATAATGIIKVGLTDGSGTAITSTSNAIDVNIKSGGGSGFSVTDEAAWTAGTSAFVPTGGVFNDSAAALTSGQEGSIRLTNNRAIHVNLRDASANQLLGSKTSANSIPVVIASDQGAVPASQSGTWTVQPGNTQNSTAWLTQDAADGTVSAGIAASKSILGGLVYNTSAPAPTNGQQMAMQADQAGNIRTFPGIALTTLSAWNSSTSLNATQTIFTNSGTPAVLVQLTQTTTITAGASTFEVTYDGSNWLTIPANDVVDPTSTTFAQISLPYTLQANTNKQILLLMNGAQGLRIKLSTQISGSGTVTPNYALLASSPLEQVVALSPTAANFQVTANAGTNLNTSSLALESGGNLATLAGGVSSSKYQVNVAQINGVAPTMGNGVSGTGVQRVTIASDSTGQVTLAAGTQVIGALTANQSVNIAQVAGGTASNAGQTGAIQVGGAVATNNNVSSATNPLLIAGSDYGGTPKVQSLKVDSSGNAQVAITNTPTVTANIGTSGSLALDTSVNGILLSQASTTSGQKGPLIQGAVTTNAPSYTTAQTSPLSLDTSGLLRASLKDTPSNTNNLNVNIAASAATVTVSGTVTANQGGSNWSTNVAQIGGTNVVTGGASGLLAIAGPVASGSSNADNPLKIGGAFNTTQPTVTNGQIVDAQMTARGAQIVATGTDTFNVTVNAALPAGSATIGAVTQASGPWTSNVTQFGSNNVATGTGASGSGIPRVTVSNDSEVQLWDGTNGPVAVKAANTPATLTDKSIVHTLSPNNTGLPVNTPAIVQSTNNKSSGSVASLAKAFVSNNVAGNSIIVVCAVGNGTAPTISDTNSNTYTQAVQIANSTTLNVAIFYAVSIATGANTVTVNNGGSTASIAMEIYEVSGLIAQVRAQPDQTASATGSSGTASTSAISALTPNEYAFAGIGIGTAAQTITAGSGWTNDSGQQNPTTPAGLFSFVSMSQYLGSLASVTPQATFTSEPWAIAVATFRPVILGVEGAVSLASVAASLSQSNQVPVCNSAPQGKLTLSIGSLTANSDNSITFSGGATVARRIRIQNESAGTIYWDADTTASAGSPSLASPTANAVMVEWLNIACTTLHIFIPSGGTTTLNGSSGVKVSAWA